MITFFGSALKCTGIIEEVLFLIPDFAVDFHLIPGTIDMIRNRGGPSTERGIRAITKAASYSVLFEGNLQFY